MKNDTQSILKTIKQRFHTMMNGPASQSMRSKGVCYKLNWGIPYVNLRQLATEYEPDYELATALWKEDVRECKILATLLMPSDKMLPDLAELWMEQINTQELAEMAAFNLFQHLDYAVELAFRWMADERVLWQISAYQILARLFSRGIDISERDITEYLDQVESGLQSEHIGVAHAALNSVRNFTLLGDEYQKMAYHALKSLDLAIF